jgi:hypothetical protein
MQPNHARLRIQRMASGRNETVDYPVIRSHGNERHSAWVTRVPRKAFEFLQPTLRLFSSRAGMFNRAQGTVMYQ